MQEAPVTGIKEPNYIQISPVFPICSKEIWKFYPKLAPCNLFMQHETAWATHMWVNNTFSPSEDKEKPHRRKEREPVPTAQHLATFSWTQHGGGPKAGEAVIQSHMQVWCPQTDAARWRLGVSRTGMGGFAGIWSSLAPACAAEQLPNFSPPRFPSVK